MPRHLNEPSDYVSMWAESLWCPGAHPVGTTLKTRRHKKGPNHTDSNNHNIRHQLTLIELCVRRPMPGQTSPTHPSKSRTSTPRTNWKINVPVWSSCRFSRSCCLQWRFKVGRGIIIFSSATSSLLSPAVFYPGKQRVGGRETHVGGPPRDEHKLTVTVKDLSGV